MSYRWIRPALSSIPALQCTPAHSRFSRSPPSFEQIECAHSTECTAVLVECRRASASCSAVVTVVCHFLRCSFLFSFLALTNLLSSSPPPSMLPRTTGGDSPTSRPPLGSGRPWRWSTSQGTLSDDFFRPGQKIWRNSTKYIINPVSSTCMSSLWLRHQGQSARAPAHPWSPKSIHATDLMYRSHGTTTRLVATRMVSVHCY